MKGRRITLNLNEAAVGLSADSRCGDRCWRQSAVTAGGRGSALLHPPTA